MQGITMVSRSKGFFAALFVAMSLWVLPATAMAQSTYDYSVYVDSDANPATGCSDGPVAGAEVRLHVTATGGLNPQVTQVARARCTGGSFGVETSIGGNYAVGTDNGIAGTDVIELSDQLSQLAAHGSPSLLFSIVANSATGQDSLLGTDGAPIALGLEIRAIPLLGVPALILLALLVAVIGARMVRRRAIWRVMALVFLVSGVALAANFVVDGQVGDWSGVSPLATDPAGDSTSGESAIDLRTFFAAIENDRVFMRIDVTNLQNNAPTAVAGSATTLEDQSVTVTLTGTDNENDTLSFAIVNAPTRGTLGAITPAGPQSATVQYTPNADANGNDSFTFTVNDGQVTSAAATINLTITSVNDVPSFTGGADQAVNEDAPAQNVTGWASAISAGPADESGQALDFIVSNDNNALFSAQPSISASGALAYTPVANANGVATVTVSLHDNGGTANGGVDTSAAQTFTITVNSVNDAPSFTKGADQSVAVNSGVQTVNTWATAISAGPTNESGQALDFIVSNDNNALFSTQPAVSPTGSLTYTPATDINGSTIVTVALHDDGGTANGGIDTSAAQTFVITVSKTDQTISYTSTAPTTAQVGGVNYSVAATSTSGLPVAFTIDASASAVCTISGASVSFIGTGTCVIDADQPGDAAFNAAPQVQQSFVVAKGDQGISYTSTAPIAAKVGGASYTVSAIATSALPVAYTIDASAVSVCAISGTTVSFIGTGTCVIDANQAGDANWNPAPQAQQSFAVAKGDQTISYTSAAPAAASVGAATYDVTATATSGLPVAFTIDASATTVCSISGSTVSFIGAGTCVIDANQAGDANWNAAPQAQQSFTVAKGDQTISYTSTAPVGASVGGATYTVTATASSGLPVAFTIDASASSVCTISGSDVSIIGAGTCVIDANQAGDVNWNAAPQAQQSFAVAKGDQTVSYTSSAPAAASVSGATYTVTATATSGLPVTFTIDASATAVCSISGSTVSFIGAGTCVIDANQAGDASWNAAPQLQQTFVVAKGNQTISYSSTAPAAAAVGAASYTVTATATSGLPVTFTIDATASAVCSISGASVSFIGAGTCVIDANQAGDANWNAAPQAQQSFSVAKGSQTISYTSSAPATATVNGSSYSVSATATSGLPVSFTIDAVAASVCSISGSTVSFNSAGTCVIDANQAGDANWNAAPQAQQTFAVVKADQTISFTSAAPANAAVGGATYAVSATATSGLIVAFTIDPASASVCAISASTVSFIGTGICTINADQAGDASFNAAPQVQQSFAVKQAPSITSANATSFTSTMPGTFSVTTIGFPTGVSMAISESGALPSGVTFVNNNDGTATLAGTPAAGTQGTWPIVITASNGVAPDATQNFTLTVLNSPPMVIGSPQETFDTVGNVQLEFKAAQTLTPGIFVAGNLVANFTDSDGPSALSAVAVVAGATTNGGIVDIATNGGFTFTPKAGDTLASDSFSYQITDGAATVTRTVTVNLKSRVWFVRNTAAAGGQGRSGDPFNTLAAAQTASLAGDTVFVFGGSLTNTGQTAGITLKANQKLHGEVIGLTVMNTINGVVNPILVPANPANRPVVDNTAVNSDGVTILNVAGVEVRGISVSGSQDAIDVTTNGVNSGGATISDNIIRLPGVDGIHAVAGGSGAMTLAISNNSITGNASGMTLVRTAGTMTITEFSTNAISGNTVGTGIIVNGAIFDATPGNPISVVSGGTTTIGASGNGTGTSGMILQNVLGNLAFTDLDIYNDAGTGLGVSSNGALNAGAGTGFGISVGNGVGTVNSTGGPAVTVNNASINLPLLDVRSTNPPIIGISLTNAFGGVGSTAFSAVSGQIIGSGSGLEVIAGNGNINYPGNISSNTGHSVLIQGRSSDTITLSGAISDTGTGIEMNNNAGSTIALSGLLSLNTGANPAFTAIAGGTVTATNTTSTATTTTGIALNVSNTTIGVGGLKFRSISAGTAGSGPVSGIMLNTTGNLGSLTVSGTGSAGSGGTIQKTSAAGVSLINTRSPSFTNLTIKNSVGHGIGGTQVTDFTFVNGSIDNSGTGLGIESANIAFNTTTAGTESNLSGVVTITGNSLTNSYYHGIDIFNFNGTISDATISNNTITSSTSAASSLGSGIRLVAFGSSSTIANVTKATIANNVVLNFPSAGGIQAQGGNGSAAGPAGVFGNAGSATNLISITGNRVSGASPATRMGTQAILAVVNGKGQGNFDISNNGTVANPIGNTIGTALALSSLGNANVTATINNNVIVANNTFGSQGIGAGTGVTFGPADTPSLTMTIANNNISQTDGNGILVVARDATGSVRSKIQNNTVAAPLGGFREGIRIDAGNPTSTNDSMCLNISGNTTTGNNNAGVISSGIGLRKQGTVPGTNAFSINGMAATSSPGVENYVGGLNPNSTTGNFGTTGTDMISASSGFSSCSLP